MKLLVLGGTVFLGPHIVEQALVAGHELTLFNRGQSNPNLFDGQVEKITGDRAGDFYKLTGKQFDACIDPSGYLPSPVMIAGERLKDQVNRYVFVSSISVCPNYDHPEMDKSSEFATLPDNVDQTVYDENHCGAFKMLCEQ